MVTKEEFTALYHEKITRRGADRLLEWMGKADFFIAPASTRYHLACKGGLMQHSVHVYERLKKLAAAEYPEECPYPDETLAVAGLLHDLCKVNFYKEDIRNVKENGAWVQKPYYTVDEQIPYGHGEKSVFIIERFMRLSLEEAIAIRFHMGGFTASPAGGAAAYRRFRGQLSGRSAGMTRANRNDPLPSPAGGQKGIEV